MDYRKFFKESYKIDFSNDYDIHHIDLNHYNNDLDNLMILPKELHNKYHNLVSALLRSTNFSVQIMGNMVCSQSMQAVLIKQFLPVLDECNKWKDYTDYLKGKIPNIHNIVL